MEANENTIKLYYNTEVEKLAMPEYGRNVLKMVEIMKEIPDRAKRWPGSFPSPYCPSSGR